MECKHTSILMVKDLPHCLNCNTTFKNGELGRIRNQQKQNCSHTNLEEGWYASNPPLKRCCDCGHYLKLDEL